MEKIGSIKENGFCPKCGQVATLEFKTDFDSETGELIKINCSVCGFKFNLNEYTERIVESIVDMYDDVKEDALHSAEIKTNRALPENIRKQLLDILNGTYTGPKSGRLTDVYFPGDDEEELE